MYSHPPSYVSVRHKPQIGACNKIALPYFVNINIECDVRAKISCKTTQPLICPASSNKLCCDLP